MQVLIMQLGMLVAVSAALVGSNDIIRACGPPRRRGFYVLGHANPQERNYNSWSTDK